MSVDEAGAQPDYRASPSDGPDVAVVDWLIVAAKNKLFLLGVPIVAAVTTALFSLTLPATYTAETRILPPQQNQQQLAALLGQLNNIGLAGLAAGKNPNDVYIAMLKSRTVADALIERFDLNKVFNQTLQSATRKALEAMTRIESASGYIRVEVDDTDPQRAADIANAYISELFKLNSVLATTQASQRRLFFERQLAQAKDALTKAEVTARQALSKGGLAQVEGHARALVETTARLRGQIAVKEIQIGAMRVFGTERHPDLVVARRELDSMKAELARLEGVGGRSTDGAEGDSQGLENVALLRNLQYDQTVYELLAKQYEIAKLEEANDAVLVQVLDKAVRPDRRSGPNRTRMTLIALAVGFAAALLVTVLVEGMRRVAADPVGHDKMRLLLDQLRLRPARSDS